MANAIGRYLFNNKEMITVNTSELVNSTKETRFKGFCWNGVYMRLYTIDTPEYKEIKKEFRAIRKLTGKTDKYVLPIAVMVRCGIEVLVLTPCINGKSASLNDEILITYELQPEDTILIEGTSKYIIIKPQKLLKTIEELNCLLYIPSKLSEQIEILYKERSLRFEEKTLAAFLNKNGTSMEDITTVKNYMYGWNLQGCYSNLNQETNTRLQKLFEQGKGPGLVACSYSNNNVPTIKYAAQVAEELQLKATQLNQLSLKDFLHRKELSLRHGWIVLAYVSNPLAKNLLCINILVRCLEKIIIKELASQKYKSFESVLAMSINGLLKQGEKVIASVTEALFFSRLRVLMNSLNFMSDRSKNYLMSQKIIHDIIQSVVKNPGLFLLAVESLFSIKFDKKLIKLTKEDKYELLKEAIKELHVVSIEFKSNITINLKSYSYSTLAQSGHTNESINSRFAEVKPPPYQLWLPSPNHIEKSISIIWLGSTQGKSALEKWLNFNRRAFQGLYTYDYLLLYARILLDVARAKDNPGVYVKDIEKDLEEIIKCEFVVPELLIFGYTMVGICYECANRLLEAEVNYLCALNTYLQFYDNPKGRGNYVHPWGAFIAYKLKKLSKERVNDYNLMNELFETIKFCTTDKNIEATQKIFAIFKEDIPFTNKGNLSQSWYLWLLYYSPMQHMSDTFWSQKNIQAISIKSDSLKGRKTIANYSQILSKEISEIRKSKGVVYAWGYNDQGQLALNPSEEHKVISPYFCYCLKNEYIRKITCGRNSSFAITIHNIVYSWGNNEYGQLGLGIGVDKMVIRPRRIKGLTAVMDIKSGIEHTLALNNKGEVFSWGNGGLLGQGNAEAYYEPKRIEQLKDVVKITCGGLHSIVLTRQGDVFGWGRAEGGQLGLPEKMLLEIIERNNDCYVEIPIHINTGVIKDIKIVDASCGEAHTLALDCNGKVYGWGFCNFGQLGINLTSDCFEPGTGDYKSKVSEPKMIEALSKLHIAKVVAGSTFSIFVASGGEVYGCGVNDFGQTGLEVKQRKLEVYYPHPQKSVGTTDIAIPLPLICFSGIKVQEVACGENHSLGVSIEPLTLWSWGKNNQGQLGLGVVSKTTGPRVISELCTAPISSVLLLISFRLDVEQIIQ